MSKTPINRSQGRSVVVSTGGIVASEHPLASQAGAMALAQGGHAVDAAIAANAVMGVVCPMMCGIGGDLFAIVCERDGTLHGVNASGWAPARLTPELLESRGESGMPQSGVHSVTVPGAVAGWSLLLDRFGRLPLARLLEPSIALAENGFPVAEITSEEWHIQEAFLRGDPESAKTFLPTGRPLAVGAVFRNLDLAWAYRQIAAGGGEAFYRGDIARRLVDGLERRGSTMGAADLSEFRAQWADPVSTTYRGWQVYELPPNGAGIAALMMLNILEALPAFAGFRHNSGDALHLLIEAKKVAYADMARYVADPVFSAVPVAAMLNKEYARERAALIDHRQSAGGGGLRLAEARGQCGRRRRRHHVPLRRRSRRQHGVAHSKQLRQLRFGHRRRRHGVSAAEPRRAVHARSPPSERPRAAQAPAAHDHSGVDD